jgi:hypothetical protein
LRIRTIKKIIAAVDKFAGKISPTTRNTGTHSGRIVSLKVYLVSLIFDKYLAT